MNAHEPMFDRDGEECRFCGKSWHLIKPGEDCPRRPGNRVKDCPNGADEAALLRDVETVVRECEKLAGHRLMQVAGPARRFLNLLRRHVRKGAA